MFTSERLKRLLIERFNFCMEELRLATTLEHLSLDSLDKVELIFDIENEFGIKIPDEEFKGKTLQDMVDAIDWFLLKATDRIFKCCLKKLKRK